MLLNVFLITLIYCKLPLGPLVDTGVMNEGYKQTKKQKKSNCHYKRNTVPLGGSLAWYHMTLLLYTAFPVELVTTLNHCQRKRGA